MFCVSEAQAASIRTAFEQRGELSAVVELRRLFPGVGNIACARECVRTIVDWPSPPVRLARRSLKRRDYDNVRSATVPGRTFASPLASPSTEAQALDIASHGLSQDAGDKPRSSCPTGDGGDNKLSDYRIREALNVVCVDDDQALRWAAGFLEHQLGAEVTHGKRKVGLDKEKAAMLIKAAKLRPADGAAPDDAVMWALAD